MLRLPRRADGFQEMQRRTTLAADRADALLQPLRGIGQGCRRAGAVE
jgi:hypothetical protein